MTEDIDWTALARYLAGESTAEERHALEQWIAADPERSALIEALRAMWADAGHVPTSAEVDSGWRVVAAHLRASKSPRAPERRSAPTVREPQRRQSTWRAVRVAASIAVIASGWIAAWRAGWFPTAQPFREFASAVGTRTTITLRDGTRLVLGPATRLRVPTDFGQSARAVELDGEALFSVVHDARRPFTVRTTYATIHDVGTTFAVRAYSRDADERVAVAEGAVALSGSELHAHDVAFVGANGRLTVRRGVDVTAYLEWTQGTLAFKDTPLREVARELARTYDVDVTIADSTLEHKLVTASFNQLPLDEILGVITHVVGAHYDRTGRSVVIRKGVASTSRSGHETPPETRTTQARK